ncbi:MAG: methyltransferase domain-containing protein [Chloroflexi bacterium]|nr:methyltransferase domain-containing protein [Chloroflexota bacterium]
MQNVYDDPRFFEQYKRLRDDGRGINEAIEQPAMRALLPPLDNLDVLDFGCGDGGLARWCVTEGARRIVGVDLSERMLQLAAERTSDPRIAFVRAAFEQAAFAPDSFDLVVSSFGLHYVDDYAEVVRRVHRWLRPGGTFVFSVEHPMVTAQKAKQGWVTDHVGRRLFWAVDDYAEEGLREQRWFVDGVRKYHRTAASYVNALLDAGFVLGRLSEPEPVPGFRPERPDLVDDRRRPPILAIRALAMPPSH